MSQWWPSPAEVEQQLKAELRTLWAHPAGLRDLARREAEIVAAVKSLDHIFMDLGR